MGLATFQTRQKRQKVTYLSKYEFKSQIFDWKFNLQAWKRLWDWSRTLKALKKYEKCGLEPLWGCLPSFRETKTQGFQQTESLCCYRLVAKRM